MPVSVSAYKLPENSRIPTVNEMPAQLAIGGLHGSDTIHLRLGEYKDPINRFVFSVGLRKILI